MKQTAVEWLIEQFKIPNSDSYISETFKQALEMEKQQIIKAKDCWFEDEEMANNTTMKLIKKK